MFFGPSMLDVMIQRLTRQAAELAGIKGGSVTDEDVVTQAIRASGKAASDDTLLQFSGDLKPLEGETSSSSFSSPICDLILAVFELNKKNNWLRRQAIIIIMQQVLGSTVERLLDLLQPLGYLMTRLLGKFGTPLITSLTRCILWASLEPFATPHGQEGSSGHLLSLEQPKKRQKPVMMQIACYRH